MINKKSIVTLAVFGLIFACGKDDDGMPTEPQNNAPVIQSQSFNASETIGEDTVIGTVSATDADNDNLSFNIQTNSNNLFEITDDGDLSLAPNQTLDFETAQSHTLSIAVTDGEASADAVVTIAVVDVDENSAPVFSAQTFSIGENAPLESVVGTLTASDPDGDTITFDWDPNGNVGEFELNGTSGEIRTVNNAQGNLDFESTPQYIVSIIASDGELNTQANITINVTDENDSPIINAQNFTVAEDIDDNTIIGQIIGMDQDNDSLEFVIAPNGDPSNLFELTLGGELSLLGGRSLDFETATSHSLNILVTDFTETSSATITINVTDVDETTSSTIVSTLAGSTQGDTNGTGSAAQFNSPRGVVVASNNGTLFVVDNGNKAIKRITPAGVVSTIASSNQFGSLRDIVVDSQGNIFVSDPGKHVIWKLELDFSFPPNVSYIRSVFAGSENNSGFVDNSGSDARFNSPNGLAIDANDNIYVADSRNSAVRSITPMGAVTTISSSASSLSRPEDIALTPGGSVYISDSGNNTVGVLRQSDGLVFGTASLNYAPAGIIISGTDIFVVDNANHRIDKIATANNNAVSLVAGSATQAGDQDGPAAQARFRNPVAIDVDPSGNLYITDTNNQRIRKITFPN